MGEWRHVNRDAAGLPGERCGECWEPWPCDAEQQRLRADAALARIASLTEAHDRLRRELVRLTEVDQRRAVGDCMVGINAALHDARSALEASAVPSEEYQRGWDDCRREVGDQLLAVRPASAVPTRCPEGMVNCNGYGYHVGTHTAMACLPSHVPASAVPEPTDRTEFAWLVERGQPEGEVPPIYLTKRRTGLLVYDGWTADPFAADRFVSKADAEVAIAYFAARLGGAFKGRAVEHGFSAVPEPTDRSLEGLGWLANLECHCDPAWSERGLHEPLTGCLFDELRLTDANRRAFAAATPPGPHTDTEKGDT